MGFINEIREKVIRYIDVYVKLFKINFIGHTSNLLSYFMFALIGLFIFFCIMLFMGLGITELFMLAGLPKVVSFFLTVGVYFVLLLIVIMLRKNITRFFASVFINVLTEGDEEKNDNDQD